MLARFPIPGANQILLVPALLLILPGCLTVQVGSAFDTRADFDAYRSFAWAGPVRPGTSTAHEEAFRKAVETELASRGYEITSAAGADLLIRYDTESETRVKAEAIPTYGTFRTRIGGYGEETYERTSLLLDLVDRKTEELVWRGWAEDFAVDRETTQVEIGEVVRRILEEYPPRRGEGGSEDR